MNAGSGSEDQSLRRWRLVLGRHADRPLGGVPLDRTAREMDQALSWLYERPPQGGGSTGGKPGRGGGLDASRIGALDWLGAIHRLFPKDVCERMETQALTEYGVVDLLTDKSVLERIEPNEELARALMGMRGRLGPQADDGIRRIIAAVVEDLTRRLEPVFHNALHGRRHRFRRSRLPTAQNFDALGTLRANLRHFDPATGKLPIRTPLFHSRQKRRIPWTIVLCIDQSGSMAGSVLYSAVVAGILHAIESVRLHLVVFDTQVVDLTHLGHDPVELLMGVQLGGGTNIGQALAYVEGLLKEPQRSIVVLLSDFEEGASPQALLATVARMRQARARLLGLASLTDDGEPWYDRRMAGRLQALGMEVAALSPKRLAEWFAEAMS